MPAPNTGDANKMPFDLSTMVAPSNSGLRLAKSRLYPEERLNKPGSIPLAEQIFPLVQKPLSDVTWSTLEGGNADNTPRSGVQVVGPINLKTTYSRPAATVFVYAANKTGRRPSSAGSVS